MTKKRFIEFKVTSSDDGELINGFKDIKTNKYYYTKDSKNAKAIIELLNTLLNENQS